MLATDVDEDGRVCCRGRSVGRNDWNVDIRSNGGARPSGFLTPSDGAMTEAERQRRLSAGTGQQRYLASPLIDEDARSRTS